MSQESEPSAASPKPEPKPRKRSADSDPAALRPGDEVKLRILVGGPAIITTVAKVKSIQAAREPVRGPLLDLLVPRDGREPQELFDVGPEPAGGAVLGNCIFPCWARTD